MFGGRSGENDVGDELSREELVEARAKIEREISDLSYRAISGFSFGASSRSELLEKLKAILAEIDRRLTDKKS